MYEFYYIEANIMCIIISLILVFREIKNIDKRLQNIEFIKILIIYICFYLVDIIWSLTGKGILPVCNIGKLIIIFLSISLFTYGSFQWFIYSEITQGNTNIYTPRNKIIWGIPSLIAIIIALILLVIGLIRDQKEAISEYVSIFHIMMIVNAVYYELSSSIRSFYKAGKNINTIKKSTFIFMGLSPILYVTMIIFQAIMLDIPIFCFFNTIWLITFYLHSLDDLISIDSLTKLNNRNQLVKHFNQLPNDNRGMYFILVIDIDHFKSINDKYGHLEGDNALVLVSNSFKYVCHEYPHRIFLSRYGGDEFVIIAQANDLDDIIKLKNDLNCKLCSTAIENCLPYQLAISVGYTEITKDRTNIDKYIQIADKEMYKEKATKYK